MDKCIFNKSNDLWYELVGDYYLSARGHYGTTQSRKSGKVDWLEGENNLLREIIHKEAKSNNCVSQPNVIEL